MASFACLMMSSFEKYPSQFFLGLTSCWADCFLSGELSQPKSAEMKSVIIEDAPSPFT